MEVNKNIDVSNNKIIYKSLIKKRILITFNIYNITMY